MGDTMISGITFIETGPTPKHLARHHRRIMRESLGQAAAFYHQRFMPKHFTHAGAREYGYKRRKGEGKTGRAFWRSYTGQKKLRKGHTRPLDWSGASRLLAKIRDITATYRRARIKQHARGLNRRNPKSDIDMREEIRSTSPAEDTATRREFSRNYMSRARAIKDRSVRKRK